MSDANPQQEPSMEEILASIRRIISEDDQPAEGAEAEAETEAEAEAAEEPEASASDDVLELTEIADEEPEEEPAAEAAEPDAELEPEEAAEEEELSIDDVLDEVDVPDEIELREEDPPEEVAAPAAAAQPVEESSLLADPTSAAAGGMLGSLVAAVDRAHGGSTLGDGNRTIEDLVKEVMRPMVKEWLDENLPDLTERLVRREIERLARRAEDD